MKGLARCALLAAPVIGIAELCAHLFFARRPPDDGDWARLRASIEQRKHAGELVVMAPPWADPLARRTLGDDLMPLRDVARPDASRYASALEIGILGQHASELEGWHEETREPLGPFLVRRLANPSPAHVVFDFTDHVRPPFAEVRGTDPSVECPWNEHATLAAGGLGGHPTFPPARFVCPGGVFFNVSVTVIADEEFRPRRCIWSHPFQRGEIVTRFRSVPLGETIRGHSGMYWIIEREKKGAPVELTVRVDGETIGTVTHRDGDGWSSFTLPLGSHAGAASADVEFAVRSKNYAHRHFCFEADTR